MNENPKQLEETVLPEGANFYLQYPFLELPQLAQRRRIQVNDIYGLLTGIAGYYGEIVRREFAPRPLFEGEVPQELIDPQNNYKNAYLMLYVLIRDFPNYTRGISQVWDRYSSIINVMLRRLDLRDVNKEDEIADFYADILQTLLEEPLWPYYVMLKKQPQAFYNDDGSFNTAHFPKKYGYKSLPPTFLSWKEPFIRSRSRFKHTGLNELLKGLSFYREDDLGEMNNWAKTIASNIRPERTKPSLQISRKK
ncbi:hypothetical protein HY407_00300 [Candidatus Gottesmanbacteria bacterium]|nr:hypothetical protein [Candidatus Gottesmanbacteria bacterium]